MDKIIVIDYGSQYNQLLVRRVRDLGVYSYLIDNKTDLSTLDKNEVKGIILSGGPNSINDVKSPKINPQIFNFNVKAWTLFLKFSCHIQIQLLIYLMDL